MDIREISEEEAMALTAPREISEEEALALTNAPREISESEAMDVVADGLRQEDFDSMPWYQKAAIGFDQGVTDVGTGLADLFVEHGVHEGSPLQERLREKVSQQTADSRLVDSVDSGWKTGGQVGADVAMLTVPTAKIARSGLGLARALAAESALVGGYEGTKLPGEGESRGSNAAQAAAITAATGGALPVIAAGARKALPIEEVAKPLLERGVKLTPAQSIDNAAVRLGEAGFSRTPILAGRVKNMTEDAYESLVMSMRDMSPSEVMDYLKPFLIKEKLISKTGEAIDPDAIMAILTDVQKVAGSGWTTAGSTVAGAVAAPVATATALAQRGVGMSNTARDLMTGRQGAGGLTNTIRAMYGDAAPAVGGAAGVLSSPVTPRDLYDEKDPNDRMRLLANELRGRRF